MGVLKTIKGTTKDITLIKNYKTSVVYCAYYKERSLRFIDLDILFNSVSMLLNGPDAFIKALKQQL
jgi:hypothetical protein